MKKIGAILIAAVAVLAIFAAVSMNRGEAAVMPEAGIDASSQGAPAAYGSDGTGIWVSGEGRISVAPDIAALDFGVEASAPNVSEANSQASTAMDAIVKTLKKRGVKDKDIQTSRFSVYPRYNYVEEEVDGVRSSKEVLTGYRVNNRATVKLRNLDTIGKIIDEVVEAGGDNVRISNISFTLEDPKSKMTELREMAVADAKAKAEHLAELSGVSVGRLIYISEGAAAPSASGIYERDFGYAYAMSAAAPAPSISGGEVELSLSVQAGFFIY